MGVYALNGGKDAFVKERREKIKDTNYDQMILLVDFNGVINPLWDRSEAVNKNQSF